MVLPEEDANSLVRRFVAGHPDAIDQFMRRYYGAMATKAARLIHDYHIDKALLDRDDAVNVTLFKLWRAAREGKLASIVSGDDFWKLFCSNLRRNILHARDHCARLKRGGPVRPRLVGILSKLCEQWAMRPRGPASIVGGRSQTIFAPISLRRMS